jgi:GTP diphosphokinase / guanosine-3',5'-bis(diphosphate) 3'-diphosphatase
MSSIDEFTKSRIALRYWLLGRQWQLASEALEFAQAYHTGTRKDGVTEMAHHVQVAHYLRTLHEHLLYPEETIATAFLHDVREDYDVSDEEIRERFGDRVADAVNAMTKTFRGTVRDPRVVFDQIASDLIASVAKGSDRIHNQHTAFGVFTDDKIRDYVTETEEYFLPMLRSARTRYTRQEPVYEHMKFVLLSQMQLLRVVSATSPR